MLHERCTCFLDIFASVYCGNLIVLAETDNDREPLHKLYWQFFCVCQYFLLVNQMAAIEWSIHVQNKICIYASKTSTFRIGYFAYFTGDATCNSAKLLCHYSVLMLFQSVNEPRGGRWALGTLLELLNSTAARKFFLIKSISPTIQIKKLCNCQETPKKKCKFYVLYCPLNNYIYLTTLQL